MKPKIKRLFAREGLIIISCLLLAGVSFLLDQWSSNRRSLYYANVQEIEPVIRGDKDPQSGGIHLVPQGIILQFPKSTNTDVIKQTINRDFPNIKVDDWIILDSPQHLNINAAYNEKGKRVFNNIIHKINFSNSYGFFLIFAYPLYLLVRFVVWAIRTLIEKRNIDL